MLIARADEGDLEDILEIYNDVIATSTAVYTEVPSTLDDRKAWWKERVEKELPVIVARDGGQVIGFATFSDFRAWPGYARTVEHSVHVHADHRGRGLGTQLVAQLFPLASAMGKHVMIAGVDASNAGSIRMHERLGFEQVAHFREVGRKFDRWLDLIFLQRFLEVPS